MARLFILIAALAGALGVVAGAFGAHALAERVTAARLETFETAARYQLYHALALLAVGLLAQDVDAGALRAAGYCFTAGIAIFSGSLYLLVLTDTSWLGAVTPLGGVAFIAGWMLLGWAAWTSLG